MVGGDSSALIELGVIGAPFGVRGWVKIRSFTDPPERLLTHRVLQIRRGESWSPYRIEATGRSAGQLTAKLSGVEDRDQAQGLRGAQVCVPRSELPARDDKDFYRADLIGCEVLNLAGLRLGAVEHFVETPAQVFMVVRGAQAGRDRPDYWVPAGPRHLRRVDLQARRVIVDWEADAAADGAGVSDGGPGEAGGGNGVRDGGDRVA